MIKTSLIKKLSPLLLCAALSGCASSQSARLYVLTPISVPPGEASASPRLQGAHIAVSRTSIPKYLDRPSIVTRKAGVELSYSEFQRWGESLEENLTDVMVMNLGSLMPSSTVVSDRYDHNLDPQYSVQAEVVHMAGELGKEAVLALRYSISDGGDGRVLELATSEHRAIPKDASYAAYVETLSDLLMDASKDIAASLQKIADAPAQP